ncbi:MAG: twin-arginine translocation signal domain-containing protein [Candidatus Aminicenantes bacterium]|nr:MAG: twin-arginine translocation signal domain-containing protein [Candidatus Aminicenantes bacterium]
MNKTHGIDRRSFIKKSTAGLISGGFFGRAGFPRPQEEDEADSPRILNDFI